MAATRVNGGTIDNTTAGLITNSGNNAVTWGGDFAFGGTRDLNMGTGAVTMGAGAGVMRRNGRGTRLVSRARSPRLARMRAATAAASTARRIAAARRLMGTPEA